MFTTLDEFLEQANRKGLDEDGVKSELWKYLDHLANTDPKASNKDVSFLCSNNFASVQRLYSL